MSDWFHWVEHSFYLDRLRLAAAFFLLGVLGFGAAAIFLQLPPAAADESSPRPFVLQLSLDGEVEPILATYIDEGLVDAAKRHAALVLITMDTPGGLSDSMKDMIEHILASPVPVAVFVSPTGGRGASAGFYILLSADIAAMAPGTHAGAKEDQSGCDGVPAEFHRAARAQPGTRGKSHHRVESLHGKRSAGRENDRSDRELAR